MIEHPYPWAALKAIHDQFADTALALFNSGEEVQPQVLIVNTDAQGKVQGLAALPPEIMDEFFGDRKSNNRDHFAQFLKEMLAEGSALRKQFEQATGYAPSVLVQINEVWTVKTSAEAAAKGFVVLDVPPSESPDRQEAVMLMLHTRAGSIPVVHFVESEPTRHCVRSDFPKESERMEVGGLFSMQEAFGSQDQTVH